MEKNFVLNGNKLIRKFELKIDDNKFFIDKYDLKYHKSWDWLMQIVEKIEYLYEDESTLPKININSHYCEFSLYLEQKDTFRAIAGCIPESPEKVIMKSKLEAVYYVVIKFIEWYNENNKSNKS